LNSATTIGGLQDIFTAAIGAKVPTAFYKSFSEGAKRLFVFGEAGDTTENILFISQAGEPDGRLEFHKSEFEEFSLVLKLASIGGDFTPEPFELFHPTDPLEDDVELQTQNNEMEPLLEPKTTGHTPDASLDLNPSGLDVPAPSRPKEVKRPSVKRITKPLPPSEHDGLSEPGF